MRKNILFANLVQNTKELKLAIPWKKVGSQKEPLLYAKAVIGDFVFFADMSYLLKGEEKIPYYGFTCLIKPQKIQILPEVYEDQEVFFDGGFYLCQKEGLKFFKKTLESLKTYKIT